MSLRILEIDWEQEEVLAASRAVVAVAGVEVAD